MQECKRPAFLNASAVTMFWCAGLSSVESKRIPEAYSTESLTNARSQTVRVETIE